MQQKKSMISYYWLRWRADFWRLFAGFASDPLNERKSGAWRSDFEGPVGGADTRYGFSLALVALLPAVLILLMTIGSTPESKFMALSRFFAAPVRIALAGFLMSGLFFVGGVFNKDKRSYSVAVKAMLRVMCIYPFLGFLHFSQWGVVIEHLVLGFFAARSARQVYRTSYRAAWLFWGTAYVVLAWLQLQKLT